MLLPAIPETIWVSSRWVGLRARNHRLCRLPRIFPSGVVAAHSVTYRGGSASASHRLPCSTSGMSLRQSISNGFIEAAFDPRKNGNRTLGPVEVKLPGMANAEPASVAPPGQRIPEEIEATHVGQIVDTEAEAESTLEKIRSGSKCQDGARRDAD